MVVTAVPHYLFPPAAVSSYPLNLIGVVPLFAGATPHLLADKAFKDHKGTVRPFRVSAVLIAAGQYRICRYPMDLGMVLTLFGIAAARGRRYRLWLSRSALLMEVGFVRMEERMLDERFGKEPA